MDNGYTPATIMIDGPIEIDQGQGNGVWRPDNFSVGSYRGPITLRGSPKWSINTSGAAGGTLSGLANVGEYAANTLVSTKSCRTIFPIRWAPVKPRSCAWSWCIHVRHGVVGGAMLIDRIQDRYGRTDLQA